MTCCLGQLQKYRVIQNKLDTFLKRSQISHESQGGQFLLNLLEIEDITPYDILVDLVKVALK